MLHNGENSFVEFKEDAVRPDAVAKECVAFSNADGGTVLLGVADDATVVGLSRFADPRQLEEWVMNIVRDLVRPPIIPGFQIIREYEPNKDIALVTLSRGFDVHSAVVNGGLRYYTRVGSTSREASTEELQRLFQRRGRVRIELIPIAAAAYTSFDARRLEEYFVNLRRQQFPSDRDDAARQLVLAEIMVQDGVAGLCATVAGQVLFGETPSRFIPGAAIDAAAFSSVTGNVETLVEQQVISGPVVRLGGVNGEPVRDEGMIETALEFIKRHTERWLEVVNASRSREAGLPIPAIREAVINAVAHRDYSLSGRPIQVRVYTDRVVIQSPGRLPNGITPASMAIGTRSARNQLIVDTLRDYGYVERLGFGVPLMIRSMEEFNGTAPIIEVEGETVIVTLLR